MKDRKQKQLAGIMRRGNMRILGVCAMLTACVIPIFAYTDYVVQIKHGVAIRDQFMLVNAGLFLYSAFILLVRFTAGRFYKRIINPLFFLYGYSFVLSQVYLLHIRGVGNPYILVIVMVVHTGLWNIRIGGSMLYIAVCGATSLPLLLAGAFSFPALGTPVLAAAVGAAVMSFLRQGYARQSLEIRLKNTELSRTNHTILRDKHRVEQALRDVRQMKQQQDGDYYLTSLLISPLAGDYCPTGSVNIETFTRQKKTFQFNQRAGELGGDLCALYSITLREKKFVAILNGDAMGKSMQGAGGALVLGTVFKSFIERTRLTAQSRSRFPEQWLRQCYQELQSVFTAFEGSMMVSAVIGLLDEEQGVLYFINAEHPGVVLYTEQSAGFIGSETMNRKIGMEDRDDPRIQVLALTADQVIVLGSDGRDDLRLAAQVEGDSIGINADENLFLRCVERAGGKLNAIVAELEEHGSFTDDLSLICIRYSGARATPPADTRVSLLKSQAEQYTRQGMDDEALEKLSAALALDPGNRALLTLYYRLGMKAAMYSRVAVACERYMRVNPGHTVFLHYTSMAVKRAFVREGYGDLDLAADYGEICRLRKPGMIQNLINLADVYRIKGDAARARNLLRQAESLDARYPAVQRLQAVFDHQSSSPVGIRNGS